MAMELKNSMFIHIPKCAGRTINRILKAYVKGANGILGENKDSHFLPDTDKQVFAFVRHPATFVHSLWHHRARSNRRAPQWNWQDYLRLERVCKSENYNTFVENILDGKGYVNDYYNYYVSKYQNVQFGKMENLVEDLIKILKQNNEDFDEKGIRENIYVHGANNKQKNKPVSVNECMTYDQLKRLITESEQELCRKFDYHAF